MQYIAHGNGIFSLYLGRWGRWHRKLLEVSFGRFGIGLSVELPSTWHEDRQGTIHLALLFMQLNLNFPWYRTYEDDYQCSGPRYGFQINNMGEFDGVVLWLYYGNDTSTTSRYKIVYGPWAWRTAVRSDIGPWLFSVPYTYTLKSGEQQKVHARIRVEEREWRRWWLPWRLVERCIYAKFDGEVGERAGSWKGGVMGCRYTLLPGETPLACLRRMEREREFG